MNNKIENEFKPRTWLLIVLIVVALGISVVLINKIIVNRQEKHREGEGIFNIFNVFFDQMNDTEKNNEEFKKQMDEKNKIYDFNFLLESISGTTSRGSMAYKIDRVLDSNKKNPEHLITVCYDGTCTTDDSEIRSIKKTFTENIPTSDSNWYEKSTKKYDVILDYDDAGYINKVTIEE